MSPNWSDDEGRCHFEVDGVPCYQSDKGCLMHRAEPASLKRHRMARTYTRAEVLAFGERVRKATMQWWGSIGADAPPDLAALLDGEAE
jgi:hypothetical protein